MSRAVFLDRDGTLLVCNNFKDIGEPGPELTSIKDVKFYPHVLEAMKKLAKTKYKIVVVTNQSKVGRGEISKETAEEINQVMKRKIEESGGRIDAILSCYHTADTKCGCRKPKSGMFFQAKEMFSIEDFSNCWMIGDSLKDMTINLPFKKILVKTGYAGRDGGADKADFVVENLEDAVQFLIASS